MKRTLTAIVLIPVVLLLALRAPVPVLAAFIALAALLCLREFLKLVRHYGMQPPPMPVYTFALVLFVALGAEPVAQPLLSTAIMMYTVGFAAVLAPFFFLALGMRHQDLRSGFPSAAAASFAIVYIVLPLALILQIRQMWAG